MGNTLSHAALRLTTGAFILNTGIGKLNLDREHAAGLQTTAANAIPQVADIETEKFGKLLSISEITVGALLLAPFIPSRIAGLALAVFSGGLLRTYFKTPGTRMEDGIRPTAAGTAMAKDFWLMGIAVALITDRKRRPAMAAPKPN
jgi:uncharacterized membrane protein YkgB